MNKTVIMLAILGLAAGCAPAPVRPNVAVPPPPVSPIDTTVMRGYTRFLSDDALAGRMTGTPEADLSASYIASACIGIGFRPIGRDYLQPVHLEQARILGPQTELRVTGPAGTRSYHFQDDFIPNLSLDRFAGFSGPGYYVGTAEEISAGAIGTTNVTGAVALIAGPVIDPAGDTLRARGVVGTIQLTGDDPQYRLYVRSRGGSRLSLADSSINRSFTEDLASVVASPQLSRKMMAGVALGRGAVPVSDSISVRIAFERKPVVSSNVGCMLEGSDPKAKDTAIAYAAHYDHLGIGIPDSRGDSIYNGFSDNAAGVAMLLAIGKALDTRLAGRPRHSILLLFFTGEEEGLLGSDYYVAHPLWPLERTRGVINLDAGAPPARPWSWRIAGGEGKSTLGRLAQDVAADRGWSATTSAATPNTDYYPFVRSGLQAIFIVPGSAPYQGLSADSSQALRRRWDHYHEPADEWAPDFPFAGLGRYAEYAYFIGRALDGPGPGRNASLGR